MAELINNQALLEVQNLRKKERPSTVKGGNSNPRSYLRGKVLQKSFSIRVRLEVIVTEERATGVFTNVTDRRDIDVGVWKQKQVHATSLRSKVQNCRDRVRIF